MTDHAPAELSHRALIALLMHMGGSATLPSNALDPDNLGAHGAYHALSLTRLDNGDLRLSVVPRPAGDEGGVTYSP